MSFCYLHIGTEKTGTTSIQKFLSVNSEALKKQGIWYARSLGRESNRKIAIYGRDSDNPDDAFVPHHIYNPEDHTAFKTQLETKLGEEIVNFRTKGGKVFVISSEHCHSRLYTSAMVRRVYDLLCPYFDEIRVVCFLRPQIEMAVSLASTASRVGKAVTPDFFEITPDNPYFHYPSLLSRWAEVFGKENLQVVPFKRNKDVVQFTITDLGITSAALTLQGPVNEAFDISTIALTNAVVRLGGKDLHQKIRQALERLPVHERLRLPLDFARKIQTRFDASNAEVAGAFPGILESDLVPDWDRYDTKGNLDELEFPSSLAGNLVLLLDSLVNA